MSESSTTQNTPPQAAPAEAPKKRKIGARCDFNNQIMLLPSDCTKIIVQYSPLFKMAVVLPAQERSVFVSNYSTDPSVAAVPATIRTPELLMVQIGLAHHRRVKYQTQSAAAFSIYALDSDCKDAIKGRPYVLANVHPGGSICWGRQNVPTDLRQANSQFFASPFNTDLSPGKGALGHLHDPRACPTVSHECKREGIRHNCTDGLCQHAINRWLIPAGQTTCNCCRKVCNCSCQCECCVRTCRHECNCKNKNKTFTFADWVSIFDPHKPGIAYHLPNYPVTDLTKDLLGKQFIATNKHADAVFLSDKPALLKSLPESSWRYLRIRDDENKKKPLVIGFATKTANGWSVSLDEEITIFLKSDAVKVGFNTGTSKAARIYNENAGLR